MRILSQLYKHLRIVVWWSLLQRFLSTNVCTYVYTYVCIGRHTYVLQRIVAHMYYIRTYVRTYVLFYVYVCTMYYVYVCTYVLQFVIVNPEK